MKNFSRFATYIAQMTGKQSTFFIALITIIIWIITGPFFSFSDTWQLVINTSTTIITFLMVFIIQNTQNRDGEAMQIKLDEIIRSHRGAHNVLLDLEELTPEQLDLIKNRYEKLARKARKDLKQGKTDTKNAKV